MSLVCQLKMASLRRETILLKQTLPLTDDIVEMFRRRAIVDTPLSHRLKRTDITSRWDPVLEYVRENEQLSIFAMWDYLTQRKDTLLPMRLHDAFNMLVNLHFEKDLQPLQLNKDRQNRVAKAMLDNMRRADGFVDELSASIKQYKIYASKMASLVKGEVETPLQGGKPLEPIQTIYEKVRGYVRELEEAGSASANEIERIQIKLYEAHAELEREEASNRKLRAEVKQHETTIATLQEENEQLQQQLSEAQLQQQSSLRGEDVDRKLHEMANLMLRGMTELRNEFLTEMKTEMAGVSKHVDERLDHMTNQLTSRVDTVQESVEELGEGQEELREDLGRMEERMGEMQKQKKDKNMNVNIRIQTAANKNEEEFIKPRSDKLVRSIKGKPS